MQRKRAANPTQRASRSGGRLARASIDVEVWHGPCNNAHAQISRQHRPSPGTSESARRTPTNPRQRTRRDRAMGAMIEMSRSVTTGVEITRERQKAGLERCLSRWPVPCRRAPTAIDASTTPRQKCRTFPWHAICRALENRRSTMLARAVHYEQATAIPPDRTPNRRSPKKI